MYTTVERIGASRTDASGVLKLVSALDLIQDCSMFWMESEPVFHDFLRQNNLGMFLISRQADILRLPAYGETVSVRTSVFSCRSFYGYRNTVICGEDGLPCLLTWSTGAFVDRDQGNMARLPQNVIDSVTIDNKAEMEYLDKKILLPEVPGRRFDPVAVKQCDIDMYRHMNNAKYVETALGFLAEGAHIGRLRIEYKTAAKLGDLLYPSYIEALDGKQYILLADHQDKPYAVMEFS